MAAQTHVGKFYPTVPTAGTNFAKVRTSAQGPEHVVGSRVRLNGAKVAIYVATSTLAYNPSASVHAAGHTVTADSGDFITMNGTTTESGSISYIWIRSVADGLVP